MHAIMRKVQAKFPALALFAWMLVPAAWCSDVRLERLEQFEVGQHRIAVNLHMDLGGRCSQDTGTVTGTFEQLLDEAGFRVGELESSDLEFAVSIIGFATAGPDRCGIKVLSMVRQIPERRILRLSPASTSTRYRLWQTENVFNEPRQRLSSLIEEQARHDVTEFFWVLMRATR